jgi:hypothetical protein
MNRHKTTIKVYISCLCAVHFSVLLTLVCYGNNSREVICISSWGFREGKLRQSVYFKRFALWIILGSGGFYRWEFETSCLNADNLELAGPLFLGGGAGGLTGLVHCQPFPLAPSPNFPLSMSASGDGFPSRHSGLANCSVPECDLLNPSFAQLDAYCLLLFTIKQLL